MQATAGSLLRDVADGGSDRLESLHIYEMWICDLDGLDHHVVGSCLEVLVEPLGDGGAWSDGNYGGAQLVAQGRETAWPGEPGDLGRAHERCRIPPDRRRVTR